MIHGRSRLSDGKRQLAGDVEPDGEAGDAPEHGGDGRELDRAHVVVGLAVDGQRRLLGRPFVVAIDDGEHRRDAGGGETDRRGTRIPACRPWPRSRSTAAPMPRRPAPALPRRESWFSEERARSPCCYPVVWLAWKIEGAAAINIGHDPGILFDAGQIGLFCLLKSVSSAGVDRLTGRRFAQRLQPDRLGHAALETGIKGRRMEGRCRQSSCRHRSPPAHTNITVVRATTLLSSGVTEPVPIGGA